MSAAALRLIRTENTDEHLIHFFIKTSMKRMDDEIRQKESNTKRMLGLFF